MVLAGRGDRFLAAFLDGMAYLFATVAGVIGSSLIMLLMPTPEREFAGSIYADITQKSLIVTLLAVTFINCVLISRSGQSLGKLIVRVRIVGHDDGALPGLFRAVFLRSWIPGLITAIPFLGVLFWLIDSLWIFGAERRCLHDLMANTCVVKARRKKVAMLG